MSIHLTYLNTSIHYFCHIYIMAFYSRVQKLKTFTKYKEKAIRIISENKFNAHIEPICRQERLLEAKEIYRLGII